MDQKGKIGDHYPLMRSMMKKKPTILITNDDGINAPGVRHLWNSLAEFANLTVVAPATEQSAVGLSITIRHPLRLEKIDWPNDANAWSVSGTPADCVKLALNVVMKEMPDLIVSGINHGQTQGAIFSIAERWPEPSKGSCTISRRSPSPPGIM